MKIELSQKEINAAIAEYMPTLGVDTKGKKVTVNYSAGRGGNPDRAIVEITLVVPGELYTFIAFILIGAAFLAMPIVALIGGSFLFLTVVYSLIKSYLQHKKDQK